MTSCSLRGTSLNRKIVISPRLKSNGWERFERDASRVTLDKRRSKYQGRSLASSANHVIISYMLPKSRSGLVIARSKRYVRRLRLTPQRLLLYKISLHAFWSTFATTTFKAVRGCVRYCKGGERDRCHRRNRVQSCANEKESFRASTSYSAREFRGS